MQQARQPGIQPDRHVTWGLLGVHRLIKEKRYPYTRTLSEELECSRRTAERYIEKLRDWLAAEIAYDPVERGYYYVGSAPEFPPLRLTEGEAVAIFLAAKLLRQCRGTPYEREVYGAPHKLTALLPDEVTVDARDTVDWISFDVEPLRGDEERVARVFADLDRARAERPTVWMEYYSASRDAHTPREIDPCGLHLYDACSFRIERGEPREVVIPFAPEQADTSGGSAGIPRGNSRSRTTTPSSCACAWAAWARSSAGCCSTAPGAEVPAPPDLRAMVEEEVAALALLYSNRLSLATRVGERAWGGGRGSGASAGIP